jgi:Zn-dependent peptidase ImmA (M78 family)
MSKMKVPKSVNVLGHVYKVKIATEKQLGADIAGLTLFPQRHILINQTFSTELRWLTFLHELKHALDFENGDTQIFEAQAAEKNCEQFASFITSLQKQGVL